MAQNFYPPTVDSLTVAATLPVTLFSEAIVQHPSTIEGMAVFYSVGTNWAALQWC